MSKPLHRSQLEPGQVVFREGEPGDCAYVIERGAVDVTAMSRGTEVALAHLGAGDLFGEMALIENRPRSATVRALEPTTLIQIPRDQIMRKIASTDPLIRLLIRVLLRRLRRTSRLVAVSESPTEPDAGDQTLDDSTLRTLRAEALRGLERDRRLEDAIVAGEFEAYFQPMVALASGSPIGFEAVLRWHASGGGVIEPDGFVPQAERAGLIGLLTRIVLERACGALAVLHGDSAAAQPPHVSFNLSAHELGEQSIVDDILGAVRMARVQPGHLQVEVTESAIMEDPVRAEWVLRSLKSAGLSIGVDDFGTGYSSLSYLQRYPIDVLKIDRSFITALPNRPQSRKIVRAIVRLAHDLGLVTVAEGVERIDELELVAEYGCDRAQGFLFAPPLPLAEAVRTVQRRYPVPAIHGARQSILSGV